MADDAGTTRHSVSAVILAFNRREAVATVISKLTPLPVDEIVVVDNGSEDGTAEMVAALGGRVRLVDPKDNIGIAGRNLGLRAATGDLVLFLDDDSYPLPGAVEALTATFDQHPEVAVVGGFVRDVAADGSIRMSTEPGSFDWWLRAGRHGPAPEGGFPTFFFPEGGCLVRRDAFIEAGGFYEPYFFTVSEIDLTTRLLARGWDVRYEPAALFDHLKVPAGRMARHDILRLRIRNQLWYFWLRYPAGVAWRRMGQYLFFDMFEAAWRRKPSALTGGVLDAWRQRDRVRADRDPIPPALLDRVEGGRGRAHRRFMLAMLPKALGLARRSAST